MDTNIIPEIQKIATIFTESSLLYLRRQRNQQSPPLFRGTGCVLWCVGGEGDNTFSLTIENLTKPLQREHGNGSVMLQIVDGSGVDAVFADECIGGLATLLHGFPQRCIADQMNHPSAKDNIIIFSKIVLYYTEKSKYNISGGVTMDERLRNLFCVPDRGAWENVYLLDLRMHCGALEERVRNLPLSPEDRQTLEAYIDVRNELEFESVKLVLRWGKRHYR